ncbi:MAG TPA: gephyrin-like molybdotransferase Glp [Anaeromyxobacteraceae bacterium]|nr:gephyrin-like molybdotransferase Glp [Anaeromyxobacteraceae bacterium]
MPTFLEARRIILDRVARLGTEVVALLGCGGRVLAVDLAAPWDLPAFDNSAMDGFAVRASDCSRPTELEVVGYLPAGEQPRMPLPQGVAFTILTGAPMPPGADAVVPIEEVDRCETRVRIRGPVPLGYQVRQRGEDIRAGETFLRAGAVLGPAEVGVLASFSRTQIPVVRHARVAILSTGDELIEPGEPLSPGKIYNSNALALAAALGEIGAEPLLLGIARDERSALSELLAEGLRADALVTTAGVSMGDRDLVREVLRELGAEQVFWKVDVKPGRPTAFAMRDRTPIFSLPGNPVSTQLMFEQFVRPALLKMMGHEKVLRPEVSAMLAEEVPKKPGRVSILRVRLERRGGRLIAAPAGNQETGIVKTSLRTDGLALLPAEWSTARAGAVVDVQLLRAGVGRAEEAP